MQKKGRKEVCFMPLVNLKVMNCIKRPNYVDDMLLFLHEKDEDLFNHSLSVAFYSMLIAKELNLSKEQIKVLLIASSLHDVGKLKISNEILNKKTELTEEEFLEIRRHPLYSGELLPYANKKIIKIIRHHHEKYDGTGYPDRISGNDIPFLSRIITTADAVDAMRSKRSYSVPKSTYEIINELERCSNSHFDPSISKVMVKVLKK